MTQAQKVRSLWSRKGEGSVVHIYTSISSQITFETKIVSDTSPSFSQGSRASPRSDKRPSPSPRGKGCSTESETGSIRQTEN